MSRKPTNKKPAAFVWLGKAVREPLVHFALLGLALFVVGYHRARPEPETIRLTPDHVTNNVSYHADLLGRVLTPAEREQAVETYIEDEILLNEALKQGLDRSDAEVRRELIRRMRLEFEADIPEPTEPDLRRYYASNRDRYRAPPSTSLQHAWFKDPASPELDHPERVLEALRRGADPASIGDAYWIGSEVTKYSRAALVREFGEAFAAAVEQATAGEWFGPVASVRGVHFVRVTERFPEEEIAFEAVRPYLTADWRLARQREVIERSLAEVRRRYRILRAPDTAGPKEGAE